MKLALVLSLIAAGVTALPVAWAPRGIGACFLAFCLQITFRCDKLTVNLGGTDTLRAEETSADESYLPMRARVDETSADESYLPMKGRTEQTSADESYLPMKTRGKESSADESYLPMKRAEEANADESYLPMRH